MDTQNDTAQTTSTGLKKLSLFAMAVAGGIAVANIYYNQPMLGIIEADFPNDPMTGLVPTATQLGYAIGLFFLLPLGDILERRKLIIGQFILLAVALLLAAMAPSASALVITSLIVGACSTVAQQIVPFAASLALPEKRGATIGTVMAGVLSGILFSRALSGFVGQHAGWREMFWIGVPLALFAGALMFFTLPKHHKNSGLRYKTAIRSLATIWNEHSALRIAALTQAALFAAFSAFWTILALYLQTPEFNMGAGVAGLFGVVGAVGVFAAPYAGRIADNKGPAFVVLMGTILTLVSWAIFGLWSSIIALIVGVIVLDFGIQSALVSNQHIIYALDQEARSRLNTIFMTAMFFGGAIGAALSTWAWKHGGWFDVCLLGGALALAALVIQISTFRKR